MNESKFDHKGIVDTRRHWTSLPKEDIISKRFLCHFMSQKIDSMTAFNYHNFLSVPYQHGGTSSLTNGDLIGRRAELGRDS